MHGRPRQTLAADPARQKDEQIKIAGLESLLAEVLRNHRERSYSTKALQQNARLVELNPEVYTAWNYRKLAVKHMLESEPDDAGRKIILEEELQVVERALKRNYKSYGAWHHRKWVIQFGLSSLDREFQLLDKFLAADDRNFHGWDYRRFAARMKKVTEEEELQYTTKKINENFSNYSAWHNRSVLLSKLFKDKFTEKKTQQEISEEYELVKQAFFTEPEDQSGWFYLMWLLGQTVTPSGPTLTGFWPSNGSLVILNSDVPSRPLFWSFRIPFSKKLCFHKRGLHVVLCFSEPVLGVDSATIQISSAPEVEGLLAGVSWRPLSKCTEGARIWAAELMVPSGGSEDEAVYSFQVEVGGTPGIFSKEGAFLGVNRITFSVEVRATPNGACHDGNFLDSPIIWPVENSTLIDRCLLAPGQLMENMVNGLPLETNINLDTIAEWQLKMLEAQINTCRELLDLENDSKWAKLSLARLLIAHDNLVTIPCTQRQHMDEVLRLFKDLMAVDPTHGHYYNEQLSLLLIDQMTSNIQKSQEQWWELESSEVGCNGWLRLNHLSLSKLRYFERFLWVQRLDLSHNKLQSVEGLEALQLLLFLDVSHNLLSNVTALGPIRFIQSLQALNIAHNEIGGHTIDTHRYCFPSALNNSLEVDTAESTWNSTSIILHSWEITAVFRGLGLRQLEISGNPIAQDDMCKSQLIQALPSLIWLDGARVF